MILSRWREPSSRSATSGNRCSLGIGRRPARTRPVREPGILAGRLAAFSRHSPGPAPFCEVASLRSTSPPQPAGLRQEPGPVFVLRTTPGRSSRPEQAGDLRRDVVRRAGPHGVHQQFDFAPCPEPAEGPAIPTSVGIPAACPAWPKATPGVPARLTAVKPKPGATSPAGQTRRPYGCVAPHGLVFHGLAPGISRYVVRSGCLWRIYTGNVERERGLQGRGTDCHTDVPLALRADWGASGFAKATPDKLPAGPPQRATPLSPGQHATPPETRG